MPEFVTHKELGDKLDDHTKQCDKKIRDQVKDRHDLDDKINIRLGEMEEHSDNKFGKLFERVNKVFVTMTHLSDVLTHVTKELSQHMADEDKQRIELKEELKTDRENIKTELKNAKASRVSKTLFTAATAALVTVLSAGVGVITYIFLSQVEFQKQDAIDDAKTEARLGFIEEFIKTATKIK